MHESLVHARLARVLITTLLVAPAIADGERYGFVSDDAEELDLIGNAVAISGTTAIVGAVGVSDQGFFSGAAYVFDTVTGQQMHRFEPNDLAQDAQFGAAVGISGTLAVVGAHAADTSVPRSGAVYVYDITTGNQLNKLEASDAEVGAYFGDKLAISGTTVLVGAPLHGPAGADGAAYLFDAATGQQLMRLFPDDGPVEDFGDAVAIQGTTAVVGARGSATQGFYTGAVYLFDTTTGQQTAKLLASDGEAGDSFGASVAIAGDRVLVGTPLDDDVGYEAGAVYVFDASTGQEISKLVATDGHELNVLGRVAASGDLVVAGGWRDDDDGPESGSAYLFEISTGRQLAKLLPSEGTPGAHFGRAVAIEGDTIVIGAMGAYSGGLRTGVAYVYDAVPEVPVGTRLCSPATPNSTGAPGTLTAYGSDRVADDCIRLQAVGLPSDSFVLFLCSQTPGFVQPPGSQGTLCLSGGIGRYTQDLQYSWASGAVSLSVDLGQLPAPIGTAAAQPGETWYFQAWHRDANPTPTSNFTEAVFVTFL